MSDFYGHKDDWYRIELDLNEHKDDTIKHITSEERDSWNELIGHNHDDRYPLLDDNSLNPIMSSIATSAPDYKNALQLPTHLWTTNTWWCPNVFKVNVPGYFYFSVRRMAVDTDIAFVLGDSFESLDLLPTQRDVYAEKTMLWHTVSRQDDWGDNSYLWPLLIPGTSTYIRFFVGSATDGGENSSDPRLYFIPCKAVSDRVSNDKWIVSYDTTNGIDNDKYGSSWVLGNHPSAIPTGSTMNLGERIFGGNWIDNLQ